MFVGDSMGPGLQRSEPDFRLSF